MLAVYILYSSLYKKTYVGYTNNVQRRLEEHNITSISGFTRRFRPWVVIHTEIFETYVLYKNTLNFLQQPPF